MRVLVACEYSATVRDAFRKHGHDAWSCDILPTEGDPKWHIQGDAIEVIYGKNWDLLIAHPPCTYLSRAGARWWKDPARQLLADKAAEFVYSCRDAPINKIAIENPIGQLNKRWRYPDQTIQPYQFGHPYSKATCLWLKGLPTLFHTDVLNEYVPLLPSNVGAGRRSGQKSSPGVVHSAKEAARTFQGIADAMAEQWGSLPC